MVCYYWNILIMTFLFRSGLLGKVQLIMVGRVESFSAFWLLVRRIFFLVGPPARKFFAAKVSAIQVGRSKCFRLSEVTPNPLTQMKDLYNLGRYIAMSVAQGGSGFPFLAEPVYKYLCTGECTGIQLSNEDAPDPTLKFVLEKVSDLKSKHKQFHSRPEEVLFVYTALLRHVIIFFIPGCMTWCRRCEVS